MSRVSRLLAGGLARTLLVLAVLLLATSQANAGDERHWGAGYFPNLQVVDQDGRKLRFYDDVIKGKIVVVSFFYTRCKSICPLATARLAELARRLGDKLDRDIFLISLSVDPKHDKLEILKGYAEAFHRGPGWLFLTGEFEDMRAINAKLGEKMRSLTQHRNEVILGNDRTGEWARDSAFGDMTRLEFNVLSMDPDWRPPQAVAGTSIASSYATNGGPPGQMLFKKLCSSCHAFKVGNHIGPDLYHVTSRRSRDWLERFITSPETMRREGDETVLSLMKKFPNVRMPDLGLTKNDVADLISYLDDRAALLDQQAKEFEEMMHAAHAGESQDKHQ